MKFFLDDIENIRSLISQAYPLENKKNNFIKNLESKNILI